MHFHLLTPSQALKPYVKQYWIMETHESEPDVGERIIPTGNVQILLHYKNPFTLHAPDSSLNRQPRAFVSGLTRSWSDVCTTGETGVFAITFHTSGACHFLPVPLQTIEERNVELADIYNREVGHLADELSDIPSVNGKYERVEAFLMRHFTPIDHYDEQLVKTGLCLITQQNGLLNATQLADRLNVTPRTLERKFSTYLGKSPKQLSRIARFQEILGDLNNGTGVSLTDVALRNGYYDQAHFIHDFKESTGFTPGEFLIRYACQPCEPSIIC